MLASDSIFCIQEFIHEKRVTIPSVKTMCRYPIKGGSNNNRKLFHDTLRLLFNAGIKPVYCAATLPKSIDWLSLPESVSVYGADLPIERLDRKRIQLDNIIQPIIEIIEYLKHRKSDIKIVEFCSGSGSVALPLSYMYPSINFVFIDNKKRSLLLAKKRSDDAELRNTNFKLGNIEDYDDGFDIGVGLHACGNASDVIIKKCIAARACVIVCPCCVGKVNLSNNKKPRSSVFQNIIEGINSSDDLYKNLLKAADIGHGRENGVDGASSPDSQLRMLSKCYVEEDRRLLIAENKYSTHLFKMKPLSCTPKNDVLVGIPNGGEFAGFVLMLDPISDIFDFSKLL